jgi:hypothetical protein
MAMAIYRVTKTEPDITFETWEIDAVSDIDAMRKLLEQEGYILERKNEQSGMFEPLFLN